LNADAAESSPADFLRRALRWLAVVSLVYSGISLLNQAVYLGVEGWPRYSMTFRASGWQRVEMFNMTCTAVSMLTLGIGAVGLLKWKRWSRIVLLVASAAMIVFALLSHVGSFVIYSQYAANARATTRFNGPSLWFYAWWGFEQWVTSSAFPLLVLLAMAQHEVATLWARGGAGGFEILPLAAAVSERNLP
jgi:hypothetical protein